MTDFAKPGAGAICDGVWLPMRQRYRVGGFMKLYKRLFARVLPVAMLPVFMISLSLSAEARDSSQRAAFMRANPCPANGATKGKCPGYVVDHIEPLCAGGADRPHNMQWQSVADGKLKDRKERSVCQGMRASVIHRSNQER